MFRISQQAQKYHQRIALLDVKFFHIMWGANLGVEAAVIIKIPIASSE
jgi:hypothetical protein